MGATFSSVPSRTSSPFVRSLNSCQLCFPPERSIRQYSTTTILDKEYPPHALFPMPALSPTMETGTIASWTLKEGDSFSAGDVLCSIETDKASVDFEAQDDGVLAKILRTGPTAQDIAVGTPICVVIDDLADLGAFSDFAVSEVPPTSAPTDPIPTPTPASAPVQNRSVADDFVLFPSARHLSQSKGIDASVLSGSGKGGRVTKGDVLCSRLRQLRKQLLLSRPLMLPRPPLRLHLRLLLLFR